MSTQLTFAEAILSVLTQEALPGANSTVDPSQEQISLIFLLYISITFQYAAAPRFVSLFFVRTLLHRCIFC